MCHSNAELQAALQEDPTEQEFKIAVEENLVVIARTKCKIRELEKRVCAALLLALV